MAFDTPRRPDGQARPLSSADKPLVVQPRPRTPADVVEELNEAHRGFWHVQFGAFRRDWVAFPTWLGEGGHPVVANNPRLLLERMAEQERLVGIHRNASRV